MTTLSNETEARLRAEVERNTAPFRTPDIAGVIAELRDCADWSRQEQCKKISKAADTLERQAAEIERLRDALRNIQIEAEREDGRWVHLDVIGFNARAALTGEDTATLGLSGKTQTDDRTRGDG